MVGKMKDLDSSTWGKVIHNRTQCKLNHRVRTRKAERATLEDIPGGEIHHH